MVIFDINLNHLIGSNYKYLYDIRIQLQLYELYKQNYSKNSDFNSFGQIYIRFPLLKKSKFKFLQMYLFNIFTKYT